MKLKLTEKKQAEINSFSEALQSTSLIDEAPIGFNLEIRSQTENIVLSVGDWNNKLKIRITPENTEISKTQFMNFRDWIEQHQPPRWQQIWQNLGGLHWLAWMAIFFISSLILSVQLDYGIKKYTRQEASVLLENGLQQDETTKAIELLLSREISYNPHVITNKSIPKWYIFLFFGSTIISLVLSFPPKVVLGIGRGTNLINRWHLWINIISYTIPVLIISSFIMPYLYNLLF